MAISLSALFSKEESNLSLINSEAPPSEEKSLSLFGGEIIPFAEKRAAPVESKSQALAQISQGPATTVVDLGHSGMSALLERQPHVKLLRNFAKSVWVRAAIDYYRRTAGGAKFELEPVDSTIDAKRLDKQTKAAIEKTLAHPNAAEEPYTRMKEKMLEDYLVIGHGALFLDINRDFTVYGIRPLDAANLGFVKEWDGTDLSIPRYVEFEEKNPHKIKRFLAHQQVMCLINRPVSNSRIGMSHVEILYNTVVALLSGDEYLINQIKNPTADKLIDLGEAATIKQVTEFKHDLLRVKQKLAVIGGSKNTKVHNLAASADEMKVLDGATWFVRQVAAVFGISTAKLKLAVDTSRANTESMMDDDLEAVTGELTRIEELENSTFIKRFSYLGEINLQFFYPIMHRKDEKVQSIIAKTQTGNNITSINEARRRVGEKPYDKNEHPYADEVLIAHPKLGPLPMSVYTKYIQELEKNIGKEPVDPSNPGNTSPDNTKTEEPSK